jgi:hypothetical protein
MQSENSTSRVWPAALAFAAPVAVPLGWPVDPQAARARKARMMSALAMGLVCVLLMVTARSTRRALTAL